ncbi:MAG: serine/threonine-protein phosphatase, partial [Pseudomonadota bacterium]|nr:serine/threonine-protein phosphatase [Pseudomonadota bacterium]
MPAPLSVVASHATAAGKRPANEDFVGLVTPVGAELARKGVIAAIADGVSGHVGGREAAEYTVRGLLTDYYATPDAWTPAEALERVLKALNNWVLGEAQRRRECTGMATTLTVLVLRGRHYTVAHVGDSRAYLLRQGRLQRLTHDHVWDRPDLSHVLTRGIGLDPRLNVDIHEGELDRGDRWLLVTDGVWSTLTDAVLARRLAETPAEELAQALVDEALAQGASDNASALVLEVVDVGEDTLQDVAALQSERPPLPRLKVGEVIDGLRVEALLHESMATRLY